MKAVIPPAAVAAVTLRGQVRAVLKDLLGQAAATEAAAVGPEVSRPAMECALARAAGFRDAASQVEQALTGGYQ